MLVGFICLVLTVLSYFSAVQGFSYALRMKAKSDAAQIAEILDKTYPGEWRLFNGNLYKGEKNLSLANDDMDFLGELSGNNITLFAMNRRIATTFFNDDCSRPIGTAASKEVTDMVLVRGKTYVGTADVLGHKYLCAYKPIKNAVGGVIGMLFVGIPNSTVNLIRISFIKNMVITIAVIAAICSVLISFVIVKASQGNRTKGGR